MSKNNSGYRTARDKIMNMSAQILRNIVASTLNVKATTVKLSGELPTNFSISENNSTGNLFNCNQTIKVWAFEPKTGLVEVKGSDNYDSQNANGSHNVEYGVCFADCAKHSTAIFFIVEDKNHGWQSGSESWDNHDIVLYKAPDFKSHWAKIEEKDIVRWKQWLK
jgi:hypothetical protein